MVKAIQYLLNNVVLERYICYTMTAEQFEYDPVKSARNLERHGIDFIEAQKLWDGSYVVVPARMVLEEERNIILGKIAGKLWLAVFTLRGTMIRLITCHRAGSGWEKIYKRCIHEEN